MSLVIASRFSRRNLAVAAATLAVSLLAVLAIAVRAQAAEQIYWNNFSSNPDTVAFANIDGSGGGALNTTGVEFEGPEGMAYDSVTNRLFVAAEGATADQIVVINLDGSGATALNASGAPVEAPEGLTLDPATRTVYWINTDSETISWARIDGSAGGVLNTTGATLENAYRLAIDPVGGRLFWGSDGPTPSTINFANVNNSGGGSLNIAGATPPESISGVAVDPAAGRVYWVDNNLDKVSFARLDNGGGGDVNTTGATFLEPFGLAFDPTLGKLYWGNYNGGTEERTGAIGLGLLAGGGGGINVATAPVVGPQDPVVLKSPSGTGSPTVTKTHSQLTCSQGSWGADFPGSFVYQAPRSYAYQWTNNGASVTGATASTLSATVPGSYACVVTATNQTGTASQTSAATTVTASSFKLTTKKKARVKPGGVATFKITAINQGDLEAAGAKACVKVPKKARKFLKGKCKPFGKPSTTGQRTAILKVKVKRSAASGAYKVTFQVKGSAGQSAKAKILVAKPKPKKK
jgi:hypothetical protein